MTYISFDEAKKQIINFKEDKPHHYIIILDQSASMLQSCGNTTRWNALLQSLKKIFEKLVKCKKK